MAWEVGVLALCIVSIQQVKGRDSNLALLKPTAMSFVANPMTGPEHAVDGVNATVPDIPNSIFCSFVDTQPTAVWWEVDLQVTVRVGSVRITTAANVYGRSKDFLLEVYPDPRCDAAPRVCHRYSGTLPGAVTATIDCSTPVRGRTVRLTQVDPFFLCEFEVYQAVEEDDSSLKTRGITVIKQSGAKKTLTSSVQVETKSIFDCGRSCMDNAMCPYFNYKEQSDVDLCEIASSVDSGDVLSNTVDWDYYEQDPCLS